MWIRDVCILTMVLYAGMYVYHSCLFSRTLQTSTFDDEECVDITIVPSTSKIVDSIAEVIFIFACNPLP